MGIHSQARISDIGELKSWRHIQESLHFDLYLKTQEWRGYIMKTWNHEANTRVISSRWIMLVQEDDTCNLIEAKE